MSNEINSTVLATTSNAGFMGPLWAILQINKQQSLMMILDFCIGVMNYLDG